LGRGRGFFAQLQRELKAAERRRQQDASAAYRQQLAAARQAEQVQKQAERARVQAAKASLAEQKAGEREAKRLHEESMQAEAAVRNAELMNTYGEIDSLLSSSLAIDDFVNLEEFRKVAEHPPFPKSDLLAPSPQPAPLEARRAPLYVEPEAPKGLSNLFGGKKKHGELVARTKAAYALELAAWQAGVAQLPAARVRQQQEYELLEQRRETALQEAQAQYATECRQREQAVQQENERLDKLIAGLGYGIEEAVQEYVSIVLGNSVYPESFPVEHDFTFDSALKELVLSVLVPVPQSIPAVKEYKYVRAKDEIVPTALTQKVQKERYASAVAQVALRSLHEIFEADRAERIQTISLTVACEAIDAATGLMKRTPLVAVGADRATFLTFDLSNVVPLATLQHLGALVSKNPFDMVAIDTSKGVRGR
jgi:restriction system protein